MCEKYQLKSGIINFYLNYFFKILNNKKRDGRFAVGEL